MNILIFGANSQIGRELALRFSPGNKLFLSGRSRGKLDSVACECLERGASEVTAHVNDFSKGAAGVLAELGSQQFDVIINAVSATSRVRDGELLPELVESYVLADLLVPVEFIRGIAQKACKPSRVILISSVLATARSPDRLLYGSLKLLQELALRKLVTYGSVEHLLVVKVGKVIPHATPSAKAAGLARAVHRAFLRRETSLIHGVAGYLYIVLYYTQPLLFELLVRIQRRLRGREA